MKVAMKSSAAAIRFLRQFSRHYPLRAVVLAGAACAAGIMAAYTQTAIAQSAPQAVGAASVSPAATPAVKPKPRPAAKSNPVAQGASQAKGCGSPGAIGVARDYLVDATSGPRYGHQQFKDIDFLNDGEVVLTFDDGPLRPHTTPVLKALDAHCTKATFFSVGRMALSDPAMLREVEKRGHTIGTHTWSHMSLRKTNQTRARGEFELGLSAVAKALGHPPAPMFRFPYLDSPKSMLDYARARKVGVFSIDVDSNDWRTKDPGAVHRTVLAQLEQRRKGIILFHDIQPSTASALMGLLDALKARGFKVVHMTSNTQVATLPEFDAIAEKEMARKSKLASSDPLASRSVVWPMAGTEAVQKAAAKAAPPADDEMLPWGVKATRQAPITQTAPPASKPKPKSDDSDWATKLFNF